MLYLFSAFRLSRCGSHRQFRQARQGSPALNAASGSAHLHPLVLSFLVISLILVLAALAPDACAQSTLPAPTGVAVRGGTNQVTVTWNNVPGATTYNLYRSLSSGTETSLRVGIPPTPPVSTGTTSYTDTSSINDQSGYYYEVTAVGPGGESAKSSEASCQGIDSPSGVTLHAGDSQVSLSWATAAGAVTYNVYRGTATGTETLLASGTGLSSSVRTFTDTTAVNSTAYYYYVTALRTPTSTSTSESAPSAEVSGTPLPPPPLAPTSLTPTAGNAQIGLTWTASATATSYNVYRGTSAGAESSTPVATGVTGTSYTDTGLTNGQAYAYVVTAVNAGGQSALSNEVTATPNGACPVPTGLVALPGNAKVTLVWNQVAGASGYKVYRGTTSGSLSLLVSVGNVTTASVSYTDTTAANGTTYYYAVASLNGSVLSAQSATVAAMPGTPPTTPTGVSALARNLAAGQVAVSWGTVSGASTYNVYRGTGGAGKESAPAAGDRRDRHQLHRRRGHDRRDHLLPGHSGRGGVRQQRGTGERQVLGGVGDLADGAGQRGDASGQFADIAVLDGGAGGQQLHPVPGDADGRRIFLQAGPGPCGLPGQRLDQRQRRRRSPHRPQQRDDLLLPGVRCCRHEQRKRALGGSFGDAERAAAADAAEHDLDAGQRAGSGVLDGFFGGDRLPCVPGADQRGRRGHIHRDGQQRADLYGYGSDQRDGLLLPGDGLQRQRRECASDGRERDPAGASGGSRLPVGDGGFGDEHPVVLAVRDEREQLQGGA